MKREGMKDEMLRAIALGNLFSLKEIYDAYRRLKSYDLTIKACEMAREHFVSLVTTVEEVLKEKDDTPKVCCDAMEKARRGDIIHGHPDIRNDSLWISCGLGTPLMSIIFCPFCGKELPEGES